MKFTDEFNIKKQKAERWFDPVLTVDTKLFIDPFLIYDNEEGVFVGSHASIIELFNDAFKLIARSHGEEESVYWKRASRILLFPEAQELCLGYASQSTRGSGAGSGFSNLVSRALWEATKAGLTELSHFEEVGILQEGIGADRISDIAANILRSRFADYTKAICVKHQVQLKSFLYQRGIYSHEKERWVSATFKAPENPYTKTPILLCPTKYLRELPTISPDAFWAYCYDNENEVLRDQFGDDISRHVDKETIVEFAKSHPELRKAFISHTESSSSSPYDLEKDRKGYVLWYSATEEYCDKKPLELKIRNKADFQEAVKSFVREFQNYIENNGGWRLLWNDGGKPKSEEAAQLLFLGIVKHYCHANNIDISKEVNIGRGPVDFKLSRGSKFRALLELKLAKNSKFWRGLARQLPKYQEAEGVQIGFFIVIAYTDEDVERIASIQRKVRSVNRETGYEISAIIVDASHSPPSASLL